MRTSKLLSNAGRCNNSRSRPRIYINCVTLNHAADYVFICKSKTTVKVHKNIPRIMAQTTGQTLLVDEARLEDNVTSVNPCPDHEKLGDEVEASTAEIHGYLQKYATIERLDLPLTQQLQRLQRKLRDQFPHLDTLRTYGGSVADRNDCDELEQWVTTCEKDSKQLGGISGSKVDKVLNQACGG